jgi:hypothetical protein
MEHQHRPEILNEEQQLTWQWHQQDHQTQNPLGLTRRRWIACVSLTLMAGTVWCIGS